MLAFAASAGTAEACGLVLDTGRVYPCRNLAADPLTQFRIDPVDYAAAERLGGVVGVWHSHPDATADPSLVDLAMCERTALPWHIVSHPGGDYRYVEPSGWRAPYLARPYCYGVFDCWELVRDWYAAERGQALGRSPAAALDGWWERGENVLERDAARFGFARVSGPPQRGDIIMMQIRASVANHVALWLGDGAILHHLRDRQSETHLFGGYWERCAVGVWRHGHE